MDYPPGVLGPLLDYLREKKLEGPDAPAAWPPAVDDGSS